MKEALEWLEENGKGPTLVNPKTLTWERGPINPESGAPNTYVISGFDLSNNPEAQDGLTSELTIYFQNGVMPAVGANGVTPQILLELMIDRFEHYQRGELACEENDLAIQGMRDAVTAIKNRQAARAERGVLNTMQK
ncbi:hypothetical protein D3C81_316600 [compost metagenome]